MEALFSESFHLAYSDKNIISLACLCEVVLPDNQQTVNFSKGAMILQMALQFLVL